MITGTPMRTITVTRVTMRTMHIRTVMPTNTRMTMGIPTATIMPLRTTAMSMGRTASTTTEGWSR